MAVLQFYIELKDTNPKVWRRIQIPAHYTFYQLHKTIQDAFGWENRHLFRFSEKDMMDKDSIEMIYEDMDVTNGYKIKDARRTKVIKQFNQQQKRMMYIYDFGDQWEHWVLFEKYEEELENTQCIEGRGACPPEDCGGLPAYKRILRLLSEKEEEDLHGDEDLLMMLPEGEWDENKCDIAEINRRLCLLD